MDLMARLRFTVRSIDAIQAPSKGQIDYWDSTMPGFGLRVTTQGRKSWIVMYRHEGIKRRLTLGIYPAMSLASSRDAASEAIRAAAHGSDPASEKTARRKAETFGELAEEYIERYAKPRKRSWRKDRLALDRDLLPALKNRKATDIRRRDIIKVLDGIIERGAPIQANRTLEIIRKIFNWGISREIVNVNPCQMIERPAQENPRERVLTDDEICAVWKALDRESELMRAMFHMRFLTAQRGGEISHMRWKDIAGNWWTIPGEFTKNGLAHRVPLSPSAMILLKELKGDDMGVPTGWVFPRSRGAGPITAIWKAAGRLRTRSGVEFVPHDLRRTAASRMTGDLGISRLTVSKILNHVESGITAVYDRHSYNPEKRQALDAWSRRLDEILTGAPSGANVVSLAGASRPA
jgi:integrase